MAPISTSSMATIVLVLMIADCEGYISIVRDNAETVSSTKKTEGLQKGEAGGIRGEGEEVASLTVAEAAENWDEGKGAGGLLETDAAGIQDEGAELAGLKETVRTTDAAKLVSFQHEANKRPGQPDWKIPLKAWKEIWRFVQGELINRKVAQEDADEKYELEQNMIPLGKHTAKQIEKKVNRVESDVKKWFEHDPYTTEKRETKWVEDKETYVEFMLTTYVEGGEQKHGMDKLWKVVQNHRYML